MQVLLAKALQGLDSALQQDLVSGEGSGLEKGSSAEITYTGWLVQDSAFGQVSTWCFMCDHLFPLVY